MPPCLQVRQGELADPLYFDFIAFAQYATICAAFAAAPQVFQARCVVELVRGSAPLKAVWARGS